MSANINWYPVGAEQRAKYMEDLKRRIADSNERLARAKESISGGLQLPNIFGGLEKFGKNVMTLGYITVAIVGGIVIIKVVDVVKD